MGQVGPMRPIFYFPGKAAEMTGKFALQRRPLLQRVIRSYRGFRAIRIGRWRSLCWAVEMALK